MKLYLEQEFGTNRLNSELKDKCYEYYFIKKEGENIRFLKVNYKSSDKLSELDNCELEKIYILSKYSGMGIGKLEMNQIIINVLKKREKFFIYMIDTNKNAIAFYEKLGFKFHSKTRLEVPNFREEQEPNTPNFEAIDPEQVSHTIDQINQTLVGKEIDKKVSPDKLTADAVYGNEGNYTDLENKNIEAFVKYSYFH